MTPIVRMPLAPATLRSVVGELVRDTRLVIGWSQRELADLAHVSRAAVWRLETNQKAGVDLDVIDGVLHELGLRITLEVEGQHVAARRGQRDLVHSRLVARLAARLRRLGWLVATEVPTGPSAPTGWIDILAFRAADNALLVIEVKTTIPDAGDLLRQVSRYEREATWAAQRQGWQPTTTRVAVVVLDTAEVREALDGNRDLLGTAMPGDPRVLEAWIHAPVGSPGLRTIVASDFRKRRAPGLFPTVLGGRRAAPAYVDYAAVAAALTARRGRRPRARVPDRPDEAGDADDETLVR